MGLLPAERGQRFADDWWAAIRSKASRQLKSRLCIHWCTIKRASFYTLVIPSHSHWFTSVYKVIFLVIFFKGVWLWVSSWVRSCCWFSLEILDGCHDGTMWPSWRPIRSVHLLWFVSKSPQMDKKSEKCWKIIFKWIQRGLWSSFMILFCSADPPGGPVSAGHGGFLRQCGGSSAMAGTDRMYLRNAAGFTKKGQH